MSTLDSATIALLMRTELLRVGRFASTSPRFIEFDLALSLRYINHYKIKIKGRQLIRQGWTVVGVVYWDGSG
jgi:hypothetical protein